MHHARDWDELTTVFDFFEGRTLVRPDVSRAEAELIAAELFGVSGEARELGSNQDRNFKIDSPGPQGVISVLLKFDNSAFSEQEIRAQHQVLQRLAERGMKVPVPVASRTGDTVCAWTTEDGRELRVRMLTFIEGASLVDQGYLSRAVIERLGALSGTVVHELAGHRDEALERTLQWDLRNATRVIERLLPDVADPLRRGRLEAVGSAASARLELVADRLTVQAIHGDLTDDNVIGTRDAAGRIVPDGIIDFGDLAYGWRVAELAVTVASILHHRSDEPLAVFDAVRAFDRIVPLSDEEIGALWPLVVLRGAVLVVSGEHQVRLEASNEYALERMEHEWTVFEAAAGIDWDEAEAAIRAALGREPKHPLGAGPFHPMLPALHSAGHRIIDLSVTSPLLHEGRWRQPDAEEQLARAALAEAPAAVFAYGQHRLTRSDRPAAAEPATFALVTEVFLRQEAVLEAPFDGVLRAVGGGVELAGDAGVVRIEGDVAVDETALADCGVTVAKGQGFGTLAPVDGLARATISWARADGIRVQAFVVPSRAAAWAHLTGDPAELLGIDRVAGFDPVAEHERRERVFSSAQERYYERPPQIERGWREWLVDTDGRAYLDMVNNVSGVGHGHPRLAEAVNRQLLTLNTNSRFLYRSLADFTERLLEHSPDPSLDTVLLVNSGTEAVDLAMRLAQLHTGRRDIMAMREAYHGWSMAADAVSTSAYDNPNALLNRPDWVHVTDVANTYRGKYRGADAGERYLEDFRAQLAELDASGVQLGGFICESILGNAGGVLLPEGYLDAVYREIRARGGVCIADEVQVGYGRLGDHFWGVQQQGVVPDVIAIAKAMGNAYPLGAVITRREIAESLAREGHFFSSAGGSPASAMAGLAVLDVMRDEGLQQNASEVGAYLIGEVERLARHQPMIGAVHGMGLYVGIELVRDRDTLEPAKEETARICERLLELGVIMQATSERQNVLKVKPPLCLDRESVDHFVAMLDRVLTEGW
ncbi:aminotransferase [Ruicaihuangia caeni]|uniref:Aminotransferase n=1 Tax=Ruicaihuangia caeni TaxID=3042517 RepID=A0AAW6T4M5_9MICO|nr:aminotransferase [Klugiella sp. YN-L-19]MDI2098781.1 aminotransferase [Klugiella sp. YN-L-19]